MTETSAPDMVDQIVSFLTTLPKTISSDILIFVLTYMDGTKHAYDDPAQFPENVRRLSSGVRGITRVGLAIRLVAVVDFVVVELVTNSKDSEDKLKDVARRVPPEMSGKMDAIILSQPLRQRHFEQAGAGWSRLRSTTVTDQELREFERAAMTQ